MSFLYHCITITNEFSLSLQSDSCEIDGGCYGESETQDGDDRFVCDPSVSRFDWTYLGSKFDSIYFSDCRSRIYFGDHRASFIFIMNCFKLHCRKLMVIIIKLQKAEWYSANQNASQSFGRKDLLTQSSEMMNYARLSLCLTQQRLILSISRWVPSGLLPSELVFWHPGLLLLWEQRHRHWWILPGGPSGRSYRRYLPARGWLSQYYGSRLWLTGCTVLTDITDVGVCRGRHWLAGQLRRDLCLRVASADVGGHCQFDLHSQQQGRIDHLWAGRVR